MRSFVTLIILLLGIGAVTLASEAVSNSPASATPTPPPTPGPPPATRVLLVVGAGGEEAFQTRFEEAAAGWAAACQQASANLTTVGLQPSSNTNTDTNDLDQLHGLIENEPKTGSQPFWLILIGHGTFDGKEAKFNLRGPDLTPSLLADWLKPFQRPLVIVNTASASAPFLGKLTGPGRVVISATKSGFEQNFTYFGPFFSAAISDPGADVDKDGQTSVLEAFLTASRRVAEFYDTEGRLATEHSLLDDNGDGLGTPADWFRGIRAFKRARESAPLDGFRAHQMHLVRSEQELKLSPPQREKRDQLELEISKLREQKKNFPEPEYYSKMELLLLDLARIYQNPETSQP